MFWRFYGVLSLDFKAIFFFIPGGKAYAFNSITINQIIDQGFLVFLCTFFFFSVRHGNGTERMQSFH